MMSAPDLSDLDRKLSKILKHLEHIEKHLDLPPLEVSAPKRTENKVTAKDVSFVD